MRFPTLSTRTTLGLAVLAVTAALAVPMLIGNDDPAAGAGDERHRLARAAAYAVAEFIQNENASAITPYLEFLVSQDQDLIAAYVSTPDGKTVAAVDQPKSDAPSPRASETDISGTEVRVAIAFAHETSGGNSEVGPSGLDGSEPALRLSYRRNQAAQSFLSSPTLLAIVSACAAMACIFQIAVDHRRAKWPGDPVTRVPQRVRDTLDTLAEGLVVLDQRGRIVLANRAFHDLFRVGPDDLAGQPLANFAWELGGEPVAHVALPWSVCLEQSEPVLSMTLQFRYEQVMEADETARHDNRGADHIHQRSGRLMTLLVNATPIETDDTSEPGVIVSFDDISPLEHKKKQLAEMLQTVRETSDKVRAQNEELERLATHDSLTGCVNRRRLFDLFASEWNLAERYGQALACVMVDVDHFKSVNDTHGHGVGDKVLARVATALKSTARETDIVARYGGEEFCVVLPHTDIDEAAAAGERFRAAVATVGLDDIRITASVGVSERSLGATDPQALLDQADRGLYAAKKSGRNRVVRFDSVPEEWVREDSFSHTPIVGHVPGAQNIPFHAVTALISALGYRDQETASHCRRVADLAVMTAEGLLSVTDCYTLEIAALLHDLGKIGVPDNILLKPDPLTPDEWAIMRRHERIGVEIVRASFAFPPLTQILSQYRSPFAESKSLVIGARVLAIVDAFDAMVTDRPYRAGRTHDEAVSELRCCAGQQFDPDLVERFAAAIPDRHDLQQPGLAVAKETALSIGLQIEHLAAALEDQDLDRLGALAVRVQQVAEHYHVDKLVAEASELVEAVNQDGDLIAVLESANDLLRMCRATQRSYFHADS